MDVRSATVAATAAAAVLLACGVWVAKLESDELLTWLAAAADEVPATQAPPPQLKLRVLAPTDRVARSQLQRQLDHLTEGNVVLDMQALDSLEAAEEMVSHWRGNHPADARLVCWLAAAADDDGDQLAATVGSLSAQGCSALHVALADAP